MFVNNVRGEIIKYSGSEYLNSNTSNKKIVIRNKTSGLDIYGLTTNVSASVYSPTLNFNGTKAYIGRYETQNENTYSEYQTTSNIINTSIYEEQFSEQNSITRYKSYYTVMIIKHLVPKAKLMEIMNLQKILLRLKLILMLIWEIT